MNILKFNESQQISNDLVEKYNIESYCTYTKGEYKIGFVGFIIKKDEMIVSFPKKYEYSSPVIDDIKILAKLLQRTSKLKGFDVDLENDNFPLTAYLNICRYYRYKGLYVENECILKNGYSGIINWRRTLRSSNKIISNNNLIFLPFVISENQINIVFLTDCMSYVLSDGYNIMGKYMNVGVKYNNIPSEIIFGNNNYVIKKLKYIKSITFKDDTKKLIDDLINYFFWKTKASNKSIMLTKNFSIVWESMVEKYLSHNFEEIDEYNKLIFIFYTRKIKFRKVIRQLESIETLSRMETRNYKVEFDHLNEEKGNIKYLFDSKYYNEINDLNYKQVSYYYFLKNELKDHNFIIKNGLILPTNEKYNQRIHIDRRDIDGLFIMEYYLNIKEIISFYINQ